MLDVASSAAHVYLSILLHYNRAGPPCVSQHADVAAYLPCHRQPVTLLLSCNADADALMSQTPAAWAALTQQLKSASTIERLAELVEQRIPDFNGAHLGIALARWGLVFPGLSAACWHWAWISHSSGICVHTVMLKE